MDILEKNQRYTYEDYQKTLRELALVVKKYRNSCIKSAKQMRFWENLINIPIKIMLGTSIGGGAVELFNKNFMEDLQWINYTRISFEIFILILVTFRDIGNFEKKRSKYTESQTILTSFHNLIRQQLLIKRGYEGDREEIIKEFSETLDNIKSSNIIIQEFAVEENISRDTTLVADRLDIVEPDMHDALSERESKRVDDPDIELGNMPRLNIEDSPELKPIDSNVKTQNRSRRVNVSTSLITDMLARI